MKRQAIATPSGVQRCVCLWQSFSTSRFLGVGITALSASIIFAGMLGSSVRAQGDMNAHPAAKVDGAYIQTNATDTKEWPSYGLDYAETRFSKLDQISTETVEQLGLAWTYKLNSSRGVEATPLVVDGVMYVSAPWSIVHAVDARTGEKVWTYDPEVPRELGYKGCCDVVNRGVAVWKGKVYVASYDGRLIAIDTANGKQVWETDTIVDRSKSYTITGAPRVVKGNVIIGNGGAEYGVRGYLTAYDAETGKQKWRWFAVPGDPSEPFEDKSMEMAAKTWDPSGEYWKLGGGGTMWDTMTFDPDLNLLYVGTGNGSPWNSKARSPAGGDNLFLSSIVALNPDTGEYVWHYQEVPGDNWDYTATQPMILADLEIGGKQRKVILHAPKSGFFYIIDRETGEFISAKNFVDVNWASGYDEKGRPIETDIARATEKPVEVTPSAYGARNWHPMSFNPQTGLVYMPVQSIPLTLLDDKQWRYQGEVILGQPQAGTGWNRAFYINVQPPQGEVFGRLIAWDPVEQKEVWRHDHVAPWNGGTLTTSGNLVFQGSADGRFAAYDANSGDKLWEMPVGTGVVAAPVTYELDGTQYVSVAVGWGGVFGLDHRATERDTAGTVYTFAIGADAEPPAFADYQMANLISGVEYDPKDVQEGQGLYVSYCVGCHGVPAVDRGGTIRNLGYVDVELIKDLQKVVFDGPFKDEGMPDFTGKLTSEQVEKIKAFIQGTADAVRTAQEATDAK